MVSDLKPEMSWKSSSIAISKSGGAFMNNILVPFGFLEALYGTDMVTSTYRRPTKLTIPDCKTSPKNSITDTTKDLGRTLI